MFGSIERGLDKMKNMLTPRKGRSYSSSSSGGDGPALVRGKALCNVSTTSHHNPDSVLSDLAKALAAKGIPCQQKGESKILKDKIDMLIRFSVAFTTIFFNPADPRGIT